jgi:hypothetical protein
VLGAFPAVRCLRAGSLELLLHHFMDLLILCSLPESWNDLVMDVSNYIFGSNTLKCDDVVGVILRKEMRWKNTCETSGNALTVENRGRQNDRGKGSGNHGNSRNGRSKSKLEKRECWNCRKKGHMNKDYRAPKKQRDGHQEKNHEENVIGDVLQTDPILSFDNITESWVIDSRDSFHATPHRKYFQYYVQGDLNFGQVYLGDDEPCQIVGMGKLKLKKNNKIQWLLKGARHITDMRRNLISIGKLASEGFISIFKYKAWKVTKGSLAMAKGEKVGTLYLCIGNVDSSNSLASTCMNTTLWNHRIGHMSEKGMQILHKRNLFPDLKQVDLDLCEHCVYGKHKRVRFLRVRKEKKSEKLDLVHTYVWGTTQVSSLGFSNYYVNFIDDATRKTWVYCI